MILLVKLASSLPGALIILSACTNVRIIIATRIKAIAAATIANLLIRLGKCLSPLIFSMLLPDFTIVSASELSPPKLAFASVVYCICNKRDSL